MGNATAQQQQYTPQQNANDQAMLAQTGLYMIKKLQTVTLANMGQQVRVPLDRMGITTGVLLKIQIPVNITAAATASPFAPYNLVQNIMYTDYSGLNRHNTSGYQLHMLNCWRGGKFLNNAVNNAGLTNAEVLIDTGILRVPTAVAADTITFWLWVPLCVDAVNDMRGAVLSQTVYGDHYITLQFPQNFVGADTYVNPYSAGTMTLNGNISITAYQHYIMPQQGVANLPLISLSTIYAIEGGTTDSSNIASGQTKYINWPNNRSVMSMIHIFDNGGTGTLNGADISEFILLGNGNTNIRELEPLALRNHQRYHMQADFPSGCYVMDTRRQPISTQLYGSVQTQVNIITANANAYFSSQSESTYLSGTPLPGVIQG
jgi:hypothetical protein